MSTKEFKKIIIKKRDQFIFERNEAGEGADEGREGGEGNDGQGGGHSLSLSQMSKSKIKENIGK